MQGGAVLWTLAALASLLGPAAAQFTRDSLYHAMNDRGVYLPDDYNSDLPPAQVRSAVVLCSAPSVPQPVVQSRRRPLLGPSPG